MNPTFLGKTKKMRFITEPHFLIMGALNKREF